MKKSVFILIICCLFSVVDSFAQNLAQQADSAYNKENYALAVELYTQALDENGRNATIYYNLGNAWYRMGNISQALLNYERALRVDPAFYEARVNRNFVRAQLQDKPENNNSLLTRTHRKVVNAMSANAWAWTAFIVFLVLLCFAASYIFSGNITVRKAGFFGGIITIVVVVYLIVVAGDAAHRFNDHSEAIVTVPSTLLNSSPRQPKQTEKVVPLHEGTKVQIIDSVATPDDPVSPRWYNVRINGSSAAWLRATDVTRI